MSKETQNTNKAQNGNYVYPLLGVVFLYGWKDSLQQDKAKVQV